MDRGVRLEHLVDAHPGRTFLDPAGQASVVVAFVHGDGELGILAVLVEAELVKGPAVEPEAVTAGAHEPHRAVREDRVEVPAVRAQLAVDEVVNRPAAAAQPAVAGILLGVGREFGHEFLAGFRLELRFVAGEVDLPRVGVRVDDAGDHETSAQVGVPGAVGRKRLRTGVVADVGEVAVADYDRLRPGLIVVDGIDAAVAEYPVRGFSRLLLAAGGGEQAHDQAAESIEAHRHFSGIPIFKGTSSSRQFNRQPRSGRPFRISPAHSMRTGCGFHGTGVGTTMVLQPGR